MHASMLAPADEPLFSVPDSGPAQSGPFLKEHSGVHRRQDSCNGPTAGRGMVLGPGIVCGFYEVNGYHCLVSRVPWCVVCRCIPDIKVKKEDKS